MRAGTFRPAKRSLGQNFLVDENLQRKIVAAVGAGPDDEVLEIGPGGGALTHRIAGSVRHLIAIELDDHLSAVLAEGYRERADVTIVHADILDVDVTRLTSSPSELKVVGNIPYNITTPIIFHLLRRPRPRGIVLMVQDDVADRIVAPVGTREYGALSVGVRTVAEVERLFGVGRNAFRPVPRVDSCVIRIKPIVPEPLTPGEEGRLRGLVRAVFQWRRKQLGKILRHHPDLGISGDVVTAAAAAVGFDPADRPEQLSPDQFVRLAAALPSIRPGA